MYNQVEKPKKNKGRAIAHSAVQTKSVGVPDSGFVDKRNLSVIQQKSIIERNSRPSTMAAIQLAVDVAKCEQTVGGMYLINPKKTSSLYSANGAQPPAPNGLYVQKNDVAKNGDPLHEWIPNARLFSNKEKATLTEGNRDKRTKEIRNIQNEVTSPLKSWKSVAEPTRGTVGKNDCLGFASTLRNMITNDGQDNQAMIGNAVGVGDTMVHAFENVVEGEDCPYHAATVVANDAGSSVTLEAHAGKDITRPEFHIRNGVAGFVNANNQNKDFGNHVEIRRAGSNIPEPFYSSAEQENEITDTGIVLATSSEVNTVPRERTMGNLWGLFG